MALGHFLLLVVVLLLLILGFSYSGSCKPVPYGHDLMKTNRYEAFHNFKNTPLEYTGAAGAANSGEMDSAKMPASAVGGCKKVAGFPGVYCAANQDPATPLDIYSKAPSGPDCASMGYSNSRGFLCMNEEQKRLLTTRGGNASGIV